jgi:hypothetical protein
MNADDGRSQSIDDIAIVRTKPIREGRLTVHNVDPSLALEAAPDWASLRARASAGDPCALLTLLELFQDEAASLARAVDWLHGLAVEHHKLEVAQRINQWRTRCRHGAAGAEK